MKFFRKSILYYAMFISILFHSIILFADFFRSPSKDNDKPLKITTLLPYSQKSANLNKFSRGEYKKEEHLQSLNHSSSGYHGDSTDTEMKYTEMIRQKILSNLTYPPSARKNGIEGKVYVRFSVDRNGNLIFLEVTKSSGHILLDDASLKAIRLSNPFPQFPEGINKSAITFSQPLTFKLQD